MTKSTNNAEYRNGVQDHGAATIAIYHFLVKGARTRILIILLVGLVAQEAALAKIDAPPKSRLFQLRSVENIAQRDMAFVDVASRLARDAPPADKSTPFRVAMPQSVEIDVTTVGTWESLPDGGKVCRLRINSRGAVFTSVKFSQFELPIGAELHFISVQRDYVDGPYTHRHNKPARRFGSPMIPGDSAVIELFMPRGSGEASLVVESVSHGYRNVMGMASFPYRPGIIAKDEANSDSTAQRGGALSCSRDINCPEGQPYQEEKRAVAEGYDGTFVCSGQLINNVRQDNRYLYITAAHCEWWRDPSTMTYYWNYENSGCGTNDFPPFTFSTGSTDLFHSTSPDKDINLLELDGTDLETTYNVYFMGWNQGSAAPTMGAMIGFPNNWPKQITIDNDPMTDCSPSGCSNGFGPDFWRVEGWDVGISLVGSSGSGLLDQNHLLVGVLTGGVGTDCIDFQWDEFSKLSAEWPSLQPFLDPDNTGALSVPGKDGLSPQPCLTSPGDIDGNGLVNGNDIAGFLRAKLLLPPAPGENQTCADFGNAGDLALDTADFVNALLQN